MTGLYSILLLTDRDPLWLKYRDPFTMYILSPQSHYSYLYDERIACNVSIWIIQPSNLWSNADIPESLFPTFPIHILLRENVRYARNQENLKFLCKS